ncbi:DEAD/DEAH box helicase family protein [Methanopyrus kandleri]
MSCERGKEALFDALDAVEEKYDLRELQHKMLEDIRDRLAECDSVIVLTERSGSGKTWLLERITRECRERVFYSVPSPDLAEREYKKFKEWELSVDLWRRVEDYKCRVKLRELLGDELDPQELLEVMEHAGSAQDEPKCYPWFYRTEGSLLGSLEDEELREKVRRVLYEGNPFTKGFAPWDSCENCEIIRQLREPARVVCLSFKKLLSAPFLYASHRRAREASGKEPFVSEKDWEEALKDSIVILDDAHVLPGALVVEVEGYVKVGSRTLVGELKDLALDQSHLWRVVDWNQDVRRVKKALEEKTKFREVYDRLTYELEDWIEELRGLVEEKRSAGYLHAKKNLSLLNELIERSEEAGIREWVVVKSPRYRRKQQKPILTFAPIVKNLEQLLKLLMGPEYVELPAAYLAAENRPTLSELGRRGVGV